MKHVHRSLYNRLYLAFDLVKLRDYAGIAAVGSDSTSNFLFFLARFASSSCHSPSNVDKLLDRVSEN
jgi:hypothetical protein